MQTENTSGYTDDGDLSDGEASEESPPVECFNGCGTEFDSVEEMVAVPGRGERSPRHFCETCAERIRRGPPLTDGGIDQKEGEGDQEDGDGVRSSDDDEQNPRTVSVCWAGGMNGLGDALLHRREDDKACGNQPDTHLGTDLTTAAVEDGNELCPACEWPDGSEDVLAGEYVATDGGIEQEDGDIDRCPKCLREGVELVDVETVEGLTSDKVCPHCLHTHSKREGERGQGQLTTLDEHHRERAERCGSGWPR